MKRELFITFYLGKLTTCLKLIFTSTIIFAFVPYTFIYSQNNVTWFTLGEGTNDVVRAIAVNGNDVYVGGKFYRAGNTTVNRIAKWNGSSWSSLGVPPNDGVNGEVYAIAISGNDIYVGGSFTKAGEISAKGIAKWNILTSSWSALNEGLDGPVYSIDVNGSDVYICGFFMKAGNLTVDGVAKWNSNNSTWSALGGGLSSWANAIAVNGNEVYVGGIFSNADGVYGTNRIAKWNGSEWTALGNGLNDEVYAITISGNDIYVGGRFNQAGSTPVQRIAKWNGVEWSSLGAGITGPALGRSVNTIVISGTDIYIGGYFTQVGYINSYRIAKWNGTQWVPLADGLNDEVKAMAVQSSTGSMIVGGLFTDKGNRIARFKDNGNPLSVSNNFNDVPLSFSLYQNYPNPFNPTTIIEYQIPTAGIVSLKIYDLLGQEIATLVNDFQMPGLNQITFDGSNLASGIYLCRMIAGNYVETRKLVLLK